MVVTWHSVSPHAQSGDTVGTQWGHREQALNRAPQEPVLVASLPSTARCSPVTMLSHLLINQADCNVFLGH